MGSLSLYRSCVKNILPGKKSVKQINRVIQSEIDRVCGFTVEKRTPMICVGGTARAILKMVKKVSHLPRNCRTVSAAQLNRLYEILLRGDHSAVDLILRQVPDRIHTIVPGLMITKQILTLFQAEEIIVSNYGVREGYLCRNILNTVSSDTNIRKIGS